MLPYTICRRARAWFSAAPRGMAGNSISNACSRRDSCRAHGCPSSGLKQALSRPMLMPKAPPVVTWPQVTGAHATTAPSSSTIRPITSSTALACVLQCALL
jgi:hypothetical protein